ncbi:E3 ubiquitin-protein ligase RNF182-like, partial [Huso huso]
MSQQGDSDAESSQPLVYTLEELECKICYNRYNTRNRKPKVLSCLHRICTKCLKKIVDVGDSSPSIISCPFCRHETHVPDEEVWLLEDDSNILAILTYQDRVRQGGADGAPAEVVLTPSSLSRGGGGGVGARGGGGEQSHSSSDCLVITIMEVPGGGRSPCGDHEHAEHGAALPAAQPGLAALPPARAQVPLLDLQDVPALHHRLPVPRLLQLPAPGHLPAHDPAPHPGGHPGQPGALHPGPLCLLWVLPVAVPRNHRVHCHM